MIKLRKPMWTDLNVKKLAEETFDVPAKKLRTAHQIMLVFNKFWSIRLAGLLEQIATLPKKSTLSAMDVALQLSQEVAAYGFEVSIQTNSFWSV